MNDFFSLYAEYTTGQESPKVFHKWTALGIIAAILGRHVWIDRGYYKVYPNNYIILVSRSAMSRKSTAFAKIGIPRVLRKTLFTLHKSGLGGGNVKILSGKTSPEKLIQDLAHDPKKGESLSDSNPSLLVSSELGVFMSRMAQTNGLVDILMDLYDAPDQWVNRTKTSGIDYLSNQAPTLLAATTPDWIATNVTSSVFSQGIIGRTIFVYSDEVQSRIAHPKMDEKKLVLEKELQKMLFRISLLHGEAEYDPKAYKRYETWYNRRAEPDGTDGDSGFWGREHEHVLKVAMCLAAGKRQTTYIEREDINEAIILLEDIRKTLVSVFKDVVYEHEDPSAKYVEAVIKEAGKITRTALLRKIWSRMNQARMDDALDVLMASKVIRHVKEKTKGRPARWYIHQDYEEEDDG